MQQTSKQLQLPYISDCKACNLDPQVAALIVHSPTGDVLYIPKLVLGVGVG